MSLSDVYVSASADLQKVTERALGASNCKSVEAAQSDVGSDPSWELLDASNHKFVGAAHIMLRMILLESFLMVLTANLQDQLGNPVMSVGIQL